MELDNLYLMKLKLSLYLFKNLRLTNGAGIIEYIKLSKVNNKKTTIFKWAKGWNQYFTG